MRVFDIHKVDNEKCINCNLCEKVCPVINTPKTETINTIAYACKNNNETSKKN